MNRSGFFLLLLAIISAVALTWVNTTWLTYKDFSFIKQERLIDYYLTDFSILNTYKDGSMRYLLKGQNLVHQQSSGASKIIKPIIQARDLDNNTITLTAKQAAQDKKDAPILLSDAVNVIKDSPNPQENFELKTSDLTYNPTSREIYSSAAVNFRSPTGNMQGTGFNTKLDEEELRILSNVRAKFKPAP